MTIQENNDFVMSLKEGDKLVFLHENELLKGGFAVFFNPEMKYLAGKRCHFKKHWRYGYNPDEQRYITTAEEIEGGWCITGDMLIKVLNED